MWSFHCSFICSSFFLRLFWDSFIGSLFSRSNLIQLVIVHTLPEGKGPQYRAVFSLVDSPVRALQFATSGAKLAVGFECGRVRLLYFFFLTFYVLAICNFHWPIINILLF